MALWWCMKMVEISIMIIGGQHFCRLRELRPIEFASYEMVPTTQEDLEQQPQNAQNGTT